MNRTTAIAALASLTLFACMPPEAPPAKPPVRSDARGTDVRGPERGSLPEPGPAPEWSPPTPTTFRLRNGVEVWFLRWGAVPLVDVTVVLPNGAAADPPGREGLTSLTVDLMDEGAGRLNALDLSSRLQELGTDYDATVELDSVAFRMSLLASELDPSLALLADIVLRPRLLVSEFQRRKEQTLTAALARESEPGFARALMVREVLFGDGYGGHVPEGTRPTVEKINYVDVKRHQANLVAAEGARIVVVGGVEQAAVASALEKYFGAWAGKPQVKPAALSAAAAAPGVYLAHFDGAPQSAIAVAQRAAKASADSYFPELVFNRPMGGSFTSRINMNLREEHGYTYGSYASFRRFREAGYYVVAGDVHTPSTGASVSEIFAELAGPCAAEPLTEAEHRDSVQGLLLGFPADFEGVSSVASQLAQQAGLGRSSDWLTAWPAAVKGVGLDAMTAAAAPWCDRSKYVVIVAGDRDEVEPQLASLGLPLTLLDARGKPVTPKK